VDVHGSKSPRTSCVSRLRLEWAVFQLRGSLIRQTLPKYACVESGVRLISQLVDLVRLSSSTPIRRPEHPSPLGARLFSLRTALYLIPRSLVSRCSSKSPSRLVRWQFWQRKIHSSWWWWNRQGKHDNWSPKQLPPFFQLGQLA
jgi:hypothetical protein